MNEQQERFPIAKQTAERLMSSMIEPFMVQLKEREALIQEMHAWLTMTPDEIQESFHMTFDEKKEELVARAEKMLHLPEQSAGEKGLRI